MAAELYVDFDKCTGHGRCYTESPNLLTYDEEGFVTVRHGPLPLTDDQLSDAEAAVAACPEQAMTIRHHEEKQ
jgi:ferredoxin